MSQFRLTFTPCCPVAPLSGYILRRTTPADPVWTKAYRRGIGLGDFPDHHPHLMRIHVVIDAETADDARDTFLNVWNGGLDEDADVECYFTAIEVIKIEREGGES